MRINGVMQNDINDCGVACLATICRYYNYNKPLAQFRELIRYNVEGVSIYDICEVAKRVNLEPLVLQGTWEELVKEAEEKKRFPCIAHLCMENNRFHYIVIERCKNNNIYVFDPAIGKRKYSCEEFCKLWTGYVITFHVGNNFKISNYMPYKRYTGLVKEQKKYFFWVFIFSIIIAGMEVLGVLAYQQIIDKYILGGNGKIGIQIKGIFNNIHILFMALIGLYIINMFISLVRGFFVARISKNIYLKLFSDFINQVIELPLEFFSSRKIGDVLNRFALIKEVKDVLASVIIIVGMDICIVITSMILLLYISKELFVIGVLPAVIYLIIVYLYKNPIKYNSRNRIEKESDILSNFNEILEGIETIKICCNEEAKKNMLKGKIEQYLGYVYKGDKLDVTKTNLEEIVEKIFNILIFWIGSVLVISGTITLGTLIVFQSLSLIFFDPIKNLTKLQQEIQNTLINFRRLDDIFDVTSEMSYSKKKESECLEIRSIKFRKVCFGYLSNQEIIHDINIEINQTEKVALVGSSGSGKTCLAKLSLHLYNINSGSIEINGININSISNNVLRRKIAYISQNIFLFSDSIRNNLVMNNMEITDEEINKVLDTCKLKEVFNRKKLGLDYLLNERGGNLSVGEKQRLVIARELLKKSDVIILDEATSNLDNGTENSLWKNIFEMYSNKILIIISHRTEVLKYCDRVIVMENGYIEEEGRHLELLGKSRKYRDLLQILSREGESHGNS